MPEREWWRGAVIYQIYPRSFLDANGDGVGDLAGITQKLGYVADLGVDGIWLSPFFRSPMKDFGYDVSDYRAVDPLFGTLADFDCLLEGAHALGLKVIIDQVLSHTAAVHPWFKQSRASRDNPRADWYVWADPRADGSPPNNWLSVFGGGAWTWESRRRQYYLHNFLPSQPDLNFHNPEVTAQLLEDAAFWLDRGVDGFRLDTVNFYFHDPQLRANPAKNDAEAMLAIDPYSMQAHVYDKTQPENIGFLRRLRALTDRYPQRALMGEIGADDALTVMARYTSGGDKLHMAYTFDLLGGTGDAAFIEQTVRTLEAHIDDGWPAWALSNHDVMRFVTRWGGDDPNQAWIKATLAVLLCLRGSVCLYQGDELGLPEADVPYECLQDPYGINFWPEFKGRDGARTPMPWTAHAEHAGFSTGQPWLPVPAAHTARAVDIQQAAEDSVLNFCRRFLAWRRVQPALRCGSIRFAAAPAGVLAFWREDDDQRLFIAINLGAATARLATPALAATRALAGHGFDSDDQARELTLPPYGAYFGQAD